jgi:class 3 adenylate cyclase
MHKNGWSSRMKWPARGHPYPFKARMAINTGISTVESFDSGICLNYKVTAGQVHVAARLQLMAEAGKILSSYYYDCRFRGSGKARRDA